MKTIFFLCVILINISIKAQFITGIGVGYGTEKSPAIDLRLKYSSGVFIQGGFALNTTAQVKAGAVFYGGAGYDFKLSKFTLSPIVGYGYTMRSSDKKNINTNSCVIGLSIYRKAGDLGKVYISAIHTKEQTIFTIGIAGVIGDNN